MANYTIIGGDGKQYGPITGDDLRKWISEGRLNAQSLAKADSDAEFRALSNFPELADAFAPPIAMPIAPPPFGTAGTDGRDAALLRVKSPAVGLKVTAILNGILALWSVIKVAFFHSNLEQVYAGIPQFNDPGVQQIIHLADGPLGIATNFFSLAMSVLVLVGASKMQSLRSYEFAFAASIVAMVPCLTPCCILGLPFGIWALVVLCKPEVKSQFS
ncbi:MAG TPA: DUF4339 domain-containing protein [Dongiaceae bacterium]|jgi:hypothetical protein|nr:DUF4339 domain-containing protein [Dongiaceae bacterium]